MSEPSDDPLIARVAGELRRPVPISPDFDARVMALVRRAPPGRAVRAWEWLREPRTLAVSPLGGLAMAAGVAGLVLAGMWSRQPSPVSRQPSAVSASAGAQAPVTFVFLAPDARSVALAGDFDGWDPARLPMQREGSGLWTVDVPLAPGRYQYAFVVDGRRFIADPSAPRATGDDFGTPTSVVTVGGAARAAGGSL
ncbi:MAG: isoamylase early set domain-containing protein [Gemmatimonadales bacterium]|jgi:hypothetical protein